MRSGRLIIASLAVAIAAGVAVTSYRAAHRTMRLEPTRLGEPSPPIHRESFIGKKLPSFSAVDLNGHTISPATLAGHVAVINIWATWCKPCLIELPRMERDIWQQQQPAVIVVGVARGQDAGVVGNFNAAHVTYSLVPDPDLSITRLFGDERGIPRTYVAGRDGRIVYEAMGYSSGRIRQTRRGREEGSRSRLKP